jgi:hypothetical protein
MKKRKKNERRRKVISIKSNMNLNCDYINPKQRRRIEAQDSKSVIDCRGETCPVNQNKL